MISSSNPPSGRGLDAMLIVYSILDAHLDPVLLYNPDWFWCRETPRGIV